MAKGYTLRVTANRAVQDIDLAAGAATPGRAVRIRAVGGARYQLSGPEGATAAASPPALKLRRVGQDLHLLIDGSASANVVLEGYYALPANTPAVLLGQGPDGVVHEYVVQQSGFGVELAALPERSEPWTAALAQEPWAGAGDTAVGGLVPLAAPGLLAAVAGGAAAVAVAAGGGGGGGGGTVAPPTLTASQALQAIASAADGNNADATTVPLSTYASAGVTGVTSANLAAINSVLNSATIGSAQVATQAQVQAIVDAYNRVLNAADGTDGNTTAAATPGLQDYAALGINGVSAASARVLSDVVDGKKSTDVDSVSELQALADAVQAVLGYQAVGTSAAPTAAQLNLLVAGQVVSGTTLGLSTATDDALAVILPKIAAANSDGSPIANQSEIAQIVGSTMQDFNASKSTILIFADEAKTGLVDAPLPYTIPQLADYAHLGITGVTSTNLNAINDALASEAVGAREVYTTTQLQALVNAYNVILAEANHSNALPAPTADDYRLIGVTLGAAATDPAKLAILNDLVSSSQISAIDEIAELNALAARANTAPGAFAAVGSSAGPQVSGLVHLVDLSGQGDNMLSLRLEDLLREPVTVHGDAGDVVQLMAAGQPVSPQVLAMDGQVYQTYDFNQDGHLDLLVQQAVTVQTH